MTHETNPHYPSKLYAYMFMYTLEELETLLFNRPVGEDLELIMQVLAEREEFESKKGEVK